MWAWQFVKMQHVAEQRGWTKFVAMQNQYSLRQREEAQEMLPLLADRASAPSRGVRSPRDGWHSRGALRPYTAQPTTRDRIGHDVLDLGRDRGLRPCASSDRG